MKIKSLFSLFVIVFLALTFLGCDEVPQQDIDAAQAALSAAKSAGADQYVPEMYTTASQALDKALAVVKEEESAMFSNYDEAKNLLAAAKKASDDAAGAVAPKKEEVKKGTEALLAQIPEEVKKANNLWRRAPRGKGTREPLQLMKEEIKNAEMAQADVQASLDAGDYLAARQKAQNIVKKLQSIQAELQR